MGERRALLIGVQNDRFGRLYFVPEVVRELHAVVLDDRYGSCRPALPDGRELLTGLAATRAAMVKALDDAVARAARDQATLFVYFLGHGHKEGEDLAYRLREIVDKDLGPKLRHRIRERVDPLPAILEGLVQNPDDVWAVMGTVRNRIAHGDPRQPSNFQLAALTRLAHAVATGAALNQLGISETVLCDAIDQERWLVL